MKKSLVFLLIASSLFVTGCATAPTHQAAPPVDSMSPHEAHASALAACARSISEIASSAGDATAKVVAVGAIERLCGAGQNNMQAFAQAQRVEPQSPWQAVWSATLAVADIALRGYGIRTQRDVAISQTNAQAATTQASYAAFSGMGNTIGSTASSIAGAGFLALSKPTLPTTAITINGNGNNTGGGTQNTNSNNQTTTTTRTCTGGNGGGGSSSSNAPGGGTTSPGGTPVGGTTTPGGAAGC